MDQYQGVARRLNFDNIDRVHYQCLTDASSSEVKERIEVLREQNKQVSEQVLVHVRFEETSSHEDEEWTRVNQLYVDMGGIIPEEETLYQERLANYALLTEGLNACQEEQ